MGNYGYQMGVRMPSPIRKVTGRVAPLFFAGLLLLTAAYPAFAITNGAVDGDRHPNVGALVANVHGRLTFVCSGTLISSTVFLTAAHCTVDLEAAGYPVYVTFDALVSRDARLLPGTAHTHRGFNRAQSDPRDIAVVVLDEPVTGTTPAALPSAGFFDDLSAAELRDQSFTAVGYGAQDPLVAGGPPQLWIDGSRRYATSTFSALNRSRLHLSQNPATGDSGTCYGDSGGPNFVGTSNVVGGITMTGDHFCQATNVAYRVDTPAARSFLGQFVRLP